MAKRKPEINCFHCEMRSDHEDDELDREQMEHCIAHGPDGCHSWRAGPDGKQERVNVPLGPRAVAFDDDQQGAMQALIDDGGAYIATGLA
jgi:hypothetical protein